MTERPQYVRGLPISDNYGLRGDKGSSGPKGDRGDKGDPGDPAGGGSGSIAEQVNAVYDSGDTIILPGAHIATIHHLVLTDNCEISLPVPILGHSHMIEVKQNEFGGWAVTWLGEIHWINEVIPTQTLEPFESSIYVITCANQPFGWLAAKVPGYIS